MKVLIANRGEIAVRIIRACHDLGLATVAVYSEADATSLHVLLADEAICIGEGPSAKSYLKISNILSACEITGADAIHPGYGFLAENAKFAAICESSELIFIGPSASAIEKLGNKSQAKAIAKKVKCPVIPGTAGIVKDVVQGLKEAKKIGFPLFIKASAGGGGKGIRVAKSEKDFVKNFIIAQREAEACFNNSDIYLEKMIMNPRHVEVQIIADKHGNYFHLGERDCSIQRKRQKLIEETPAPKISNHLRKKMTTAAINIAKAAKYFSCGTVEFLVDEENNYYFMEMNTRIQVEHTISEMLTGIDLVKAQIKVAMGKKLTFKQNKIHFDGHVFEFRINAEDPSNDFMPSPGVLKYYIPPGGPNVRLDSACYSGYEIPPYYDSMIAKLIVRGRDRAEAIQVAKRALKEFHIQGVKSTIDFHLYMLADENFIKGNYNLNYIDDLILKGCKFKDKK
ncbi:MAG: Biotin carboxylase [Candidatus Anoxychlamydiales bacterium]|nr:Biotin carboxylase [Candidatus Anoxychlamydiales bacterium]NGX36378.1 Biotin carboxylase [Candidatus Anoxychlamydiales bacterium]